LKHAAGSNLRDGALSPPARGRGLKLSRRIIESPRYVAPRAGAWIETLASRIFAVSGESPPARGRGLKLLPRLARLSG